jgi:hypothetical protein
MYSEEDMADPKEKNRNQSAEEVLADAEAARDQYLVAAAAREEHGIELLEQITKQLDSIEKLLRDRLGVKQ